MHVRCPHCHNPIEIIGEEHLSDVTCPDCGSTFNLLPPTESFHTHSRTLGHFHLIEHVGTGGFGNVWKAKDSELDRLVAIKIPRHDQATTKTRSSSSAKPGPRPSCWPKSPTPSTTPMSRASFTARSRQRHRRQHVRITNAIDSDSADDLTELGSRNPIVEIDRSQNRPAQKQYRFRIATARQVYCRRNFPPNPVERGCSIHKPNHSPNRSVSACAKA